MIGKCKWCLYDDLQLNKDGKCQFCELEHSIGTKHNQHRPNEYMIEYHNSLINGYSPDLNKLIAKWN